MIENKIRELRVKKGITLKDLAQEIEVSEVTMRAYELHEFDPKISNVVKIMEVLECEFWDLFSKH